MHVEGHHFPNNLVLAMPSALPLSLQTVDDLKEESTSSNTGNSEDWSGDSWGSTGETGSGGSSSGGDLEDGNTAGA